MKKEHGNKIDSLTMKKRALEIMGLGEEFDPRYVVCGGAPVEEDVLEGNEAMVEPESHPDDNGNEEVLPASEADEVSEPAADDDESIIESLKDSLKPEGVEGIKEDAEKEKPEAPKTPEEKEALQKKEEKGKSDESLELTEEEKAKWSEKSKQRFTDLASRTRNAETRSESLQGKVKGMVDLIQGNGISQENFAGLIDYGALVASQNPQDWQKALGVAQDQVKALSTLLGITPEGGDPYKDYPEIKQEIEDMLISEERGLELVNLKNQEKVRNQHETKVKEQNESIEEYQTNWDNSRGQVLGMLGQYKANDIDYSAKEPAVLDLIEGIKSKGLPCSPQEFPNFFQQFYSSLGKVIPKTTTTPKPNPLTPSGSGKTSKGGGDILSQLRGSLAD